MGDERTRVDVEALKRRVSIVDAVQAFCPGIRLRRQGRELAALSPFKAERTPSFTIDPQRQVFYCFATDQGGDAVRFVEILETCDFATAARRLAERCLGEVPVTADDADRAAERADARRRERLAIEAREAAEQADRIRVAERIWGQTWPAAGTLVETYLAARGIDIDALARMYGTRVPASLRFHPSLRVGNHVGPAMVGSMVDADGTFCGVHRTFLTADGQAKANLPEGQKSKLTLGRVLGSHGALFTDGAHAVTGEGYETTLTVVAALARRRVRVTAFSGLSLGNLVGAGIGRGQPHPLAKGKRLPSEIPDPDRPGLILPAGITHLTMLEDADGKDALATRARVVRGVGKFRAAGIRVRVATPEAGRDFNDMIKRAA